MTDQNTRDIAVAADTKVDQHIVDCMALRVVITGALSEIRDDIKKIYWRMGLLFGGLFLASHLLDWVFNAK